MAFSDLAARLNGWPRRVVAVGCLLLAAVTALGARHPGRTSASGHPILVAARDLAAGSTLSAADVTVHSWPDELRPAGAISSAAAVAGRRLSGAMESGEAITEARLAGPGLATGLSPTSRAVAVEVDGGAAAALLSPGEFVDLLVNDLPPATDVSASTSSVPTAHLLAGAARILAVSPPSATDDSVGIVVAVDQTTALQIAAVAGRTVVATLRHPP